MFVYQSTNPCICGSSTTSNPPDSGCPDECNCLSFCNITINALADEAPLPCGEELVLDLITTYDHDTCACGENSLTLTAEWFDSTVFDSAEMSGNDLTVITADLETFTNQYGEVIIKGSCGTVAAYFTVLIGIANPCPDGCDEGEHCDPCDGCTEDVPDIILT